MQYDVTGYLFTQRSSVVYIQLVRYLICFLATLSTSFVINWSFVVVLAKIIACRCHVDHEDACDAVTTNHNCSDSEKKAGAGLAHNCAVYVISLRYIHHSW